VALLVAMGFQPRRRLDAAGTLTYCLDNCPYRAALHERGSPICGLHRGLTRELLDEIDRKTKLCAFVPNDPDTAGCEITLRGPVAKEAAARALAAGAGFAVTAEVAAMKRSRDRRPTVARPSPGLWSPSSLVGATGPRRRTRGAAQA
jgi:hypothetical protein